MTQFSNPLDAYPSGAIVWFHGSESDVPNGWEVCNGNNGTPNLIERFPRGVPDSATDPGATGGNDSKTLAVSQLPSHSHNDNSTADDGYHNHEFQTDRVLGSYTDPSDVVVEDHNSNSYERTQGMASAGSHTHSVSVDNVGNDDPIENRPAYTDLIPIQKQ